MPAQTPKGIKYPVAGDRITDYPGVAKSAAETIDSKLGALDTAIAQLTEALNLAITAASGWKVTVVQATRTIKRVDVILKLQRTDGAFSTTYGGFYRIATLTNASQRPRVRSFGNLLSSAKIYPYADPNGNIDLMSYEAGAFSLSEWDMTLSWTIA